MKCITNIGLLATAKGTSPIAGLKQGKISLKKNQSILIQGDTIIDIVDSVPESFSGEIIDAEGCLVTPGLVDSHTHLVFGGWRAHELQLKMQGVDYLEILKAGGGILSTVKETRAASEEELLNKAGKILSEMLKEGITTVEAKSGYGLNLEDELKQMRVVKRLNQVQEVELVSTLMAAHALPNEYLDNKEGYIELIIDTIIPETAKLNLAEFCDVFCETGVFNVEESRRILEAAKEHGMKLKIHADEINAIGASRLAGEIGAISAEHLIAVDYEGLNSLKNGGCIACLLPATSFYLGKPYAPARSMIDIGIPVAIATDFNPGSCPSHSLQFCCNLANYFYKLTPEEILSAVTLNAACALDLGNKIGSIEKGKQADIVIWNAPDLDFLCYRFGSNLAAKVIKKGNIVV
ncbi:MAG: imidazolonepropionase [Christensenellaceae bacterium]|nr:imidazolonepropionase [Christensenellaceae bacterium]